MTPRRKKAIGAVFAASTFSLLGMAALHMPAARPLLAFFGVGCPMEKATGEQVETARMSAVRATRGTEASPARPALGFILDTSTVDDVKAWAATSKVECSVERQKTLLICDGVPTSALGEPAGGKVDLKLGFNTVGKLVNVVAVHRSLDPNRAEVVLAGVVNRMAADLGKPDVAVGERTGAYLAGEMLRTAVVEYKFSDYMAEVSATNFSADGIAVREHYISARD